MDAHTIWWIAIRNKIHCRNYYNKQLLFIHGQIVGVALPQIYIVNTSN